MVIHLVFLPGESQGQRSLVGYSPQGHRVGHDRSDLAHRTQRNTTFQLTRPLDAHPWRLHGLVNMKSEQDQAARWPSSLVALSGISGNLQTWLWASTTVSPRLGLPPTRVPTPSVSLMCLYASKANSILQSLVWP